MEEDPLQQLKAILEQLAETEGVGSEDPMDCLRNVRRRAIAEMIGNHRLSTIFQTASTLSQSLPPEELEKILRNFEREKNISISGILTEVNERLDRLIEEEKNKANPATEILADIYSGRRDGGQ